MTDKNPLAHYSGLLTEAEQESAAANVPASGAVAQAAPLTRYCPECGHVGEVGAGHRDCCPDGSHAFMVPAKWAQDLHAGFMAKLGKAAPTAVAVLTLDEEILKRLFEGMQRQHTETTASFSAFNWFTAGATIAEAALASTPAAAPLPLLVRDIARELGITCAEACLALKPLGNFSTNTAVTAEMMAKLRECFPERVPASEVAGARERMTAGRACYFMERFLKEEKLLGPNEQAALHYVIDMLEAAAALVVRPEPDAWREGAKFALKAVAEVDSLCWLTDSMKEVCIKQAADAVIAERDRQRALLAGVSAPAAQALAIPDECPHIIWYDDQDRPQEMFAGRGAKAAAERRFAQISQQWNAHLFVRIEKNSRDCRHPVAAVAAPQAQADARDAGKLHFWVADDPDTAHESLHEAVMEAFETNGVQPGEFVEIQREISLPNILVRITSTKPFAFEEVPDAAIAAQAAKQGGDKQ